MLGDWIVARHHLTGLVAEGDPRLGFWAISASYNRRATLCRLARFRSSAFDISEVVMFEPAAGLLEAKQS